ncbi:MAG TPA: two-component regulator propeller domain-containing protein, partial [Clostridia bacterium]|nr:two-component regulator propeller domain-containing protein [Clostridia bacterium]
MAQKRGRFRVPLCRQLTIAWSICLLALSLAALQAGSKRHEHPEYLIQNWSAADGVPENSALATAQTPDGYLWIGSSGGLLRFNGSDFDRVARTAGLNQLDTVAHCLSVDRSGRLWVSTSTGLAVLEKNNWRLVGGEIVIARSIAESPTGEVFLGTFDGRLFR